MEEYFDQYRHLEFFNKIDKYVKEIWDEFKQNG